MGQKKHKQRKKQLNQQEQFEGMILTKLAFYSQKITWFFIYLILILPALYFSPWHLNSFEMPKNVLFLLLGSVMLLFYLIYKFESKDFTFYKKQKKILILLAVFWGFRLLSLLFSPNKDISFWGSYTRAEGLLTHIFYALFFVITADLLSNLRIKKIKYSLLALTCTAGLISLYGVLQRFGIDFSALQWEDMAHIRIASTLGNPLYLGPFLIFALSFSVYNLKNFANIFIKILTVLSSALMILALIFTFTSSSILALVSGLVFFVIVYFWQKKKYISYALVVLTLMAIIFGSLFIANKINNPTIENALQNFSLQDQSNLQRVYVWETALDAFGQKPFFGWGHELFTQAYDFNHNTNLVEPLETNFDRAHNVFLDYLVMEGIFVFILFVVLVFYSLIISTKRYFRTKNILYAVCSGLIIAFAVGSLVSVPSITAYLMFYLTLAIIYSNNSKKEIKIQGEYCKKYLWFYGLLIILTIIFMFQAVKPWQADLLFQDSLNYQEPNQRIAALQKSIDKWGYKELHGEMYKLLKTIFKQVKGVDNELALEILGKWQANIDYITTKYDHDYMMFVMKADHYSVMDEEEQMRQAFEQAKQLAPQNFEMYWIMGQNCLLEMQNSDLAIEFYEKAVEIDPSQPMPYKKLSQLYKDLEDKEKQNYYLEIYKEKYNEKYSKIIGLGKK